MSEPQGTTTETTPVLGTDPSQPVTTPAPTTQDTANPAAPLLGTEPAAAPAETPKDPAAAPAAEPKVEAPVVPEKYEFKVPEGVTLDEAVIGQFSEVAKGLKLTQEQAQALVDFQVSRDTSAAKAQSDAYAKMTADWAAEVQRLPGIGGAQFDESRALAQKAVDALGGAELNKALRYFGWGNHPALFKAFHAAGKLMAEAKLLSGSANTDPVVDVAQTLFPVSSGIKKS